MNEFNKQSLHKAIASLPEYQPPSTVWEEIDMELERDLSKEKLLSELKELPSYDPPQKIWKNIARKLSARKNPGGVKVVLLGRWKRMGSIAAAVVVLLTVTWWLQKKKQTSEIRLSYSVETVDDELLKRDWNDDEDGFKQIEAICRNHKFISDRPDFKQLREELEELAGAKKALEQAIGKYGTGVELINQIKSIELERTDILEKMVDKMI